MVNLENKETLTGKELKSLKDKYGLSMTQLDNALNQKSAWNHLTKYQDKPLPEDKAKGYIKLFQSIDNNGGKLPTKGKSNTIAENGSNTKVLRNTKGRKNKTNKKKLVLAKTAGSNGEVTHTPNIHTAQAERSIKINYQGAVIEIPFSDTNEMNNIIKSMKEMFNK